MAQTKTRSSRSSNASSGGAKKRSSSRKPSSSRSKSSSARGSARGRKTSGKSSAQSRSRTTSTRSQGNHDKSTLGTIAEKAKGPALAGGAALIGIAGGVALTRKQKRRGVLSKVPKPNLKVPSMSTPDISLPKPDAVAKAIGNAAGRVADGSERVGRLATGVQRASRAINGSQADGDD